MIVYNYCYFICFGCIVNWCGINKMGFIEYKCWEGLFKFFELYINIVFNGLMYIKFIICKFLLVKMLMEIFEMRVMVKLGMK